jgi:hypothetical protein
MQSSTAGSRKPSPRPTLTTVRAIEQAKRRSSRGCRINWTRRLIGHTVSSPAPRAKTPMLCRRPSSRIPQSQSERIAPQLERVETSTATGLVVLGRDGAGLAWTPKQAPTEGNELHRHRPLIRSATSANLTCGAGPLASLITNAAIDPVLKPTAEATADSGRSTSVMTVESRVPRNHSSQLDLTVRARWRRRRHVPGCRKRPEIAVPPPARRPTPGHCRR